MPRKSNGRFALDGIRVIDFCWGWAGPYAASMMSFMGAEVIKIENRKVIDFNRRMLDPFTRLPVGANRSPYFNFANTNKLSITLNLDTAEGVALAKKLAQKGDVVLESRRIGAMAEVGLDYESLARLKRDIIMLSISTAGQSGPEALYKGYAPMFCALSSLGHITGYQDAPPTEIRFNMDLACAMTALFALLSALVHRQRTGEGQYIDLSTRETITCLVGDSLMDCIMNGRVPGRRGNEQPVMAPNNCYPCQGKDRWVSICIANDEEWQAFQKALGHPEWARAENFADVPGRWDHREELDKMIGAWTRERTPFEVMDLLQAHGVAAVPSYNAEDLYRDPHLQERKFYGSIEHREMGQLVIMNPPLRFSATPARVRRAAPLLGQHNEYVFGEVLGLKASEIKRLEAENII